MLFLFYSFTETNAEDEIFGIRRKPRDPIHDIEILTAWSEEVASNWVGFFDLNGVKPLLGIPDDMDVLAILPFGYPIRAVGKGKKRRKPLNEGPIVDGSDSLYRGIVGIGRDEGIYKEAGV